MQGSFFLWLVVAISGSLAQHKGTPYGFAAGVTGGGSASPSYPSSIAQYVHSYWSPTDNLQY